jgi:hypothetical protein
MVEPLVSLVYQLRPNGWILPQQKADIQFEEFLVPT